MKKNDIRSGQYWAAKYNGRNGDLIIGRVKSVRTTGEVVLVNLLTASIATKSVNVLRRRNCKVSKADACEIQAVYSQTGDRQAARAKAVELTNKQRELPLEPRVQEIARPSTAKELNENVESLVRETNLKLQFVLAEFTAKLLDLVKASL